jgi:flagellar motor switch/type III secretory pathway protein FliN
MQKEELAGQIDDLGVRVAIEIGEVELSLGELAGLRAGSRVELSAELPLRCYLKVGVTTIAVGELEQVDDGLQILVREVIG